MEGSNDRDTPSPSRKLTSYGEDGEIDVLALLEAAESESSQQEELVASPCVSESSKDEEDEGSYQGEIDEGFDEEFDTEDPLAKEEGDPSLAPSFDMLNDLNEKELQHLLADDVAMSANNSLPLPNPMLYDDFDYGVDVLDTETPSHNLLDSEPVKSPTPFSCVPGSPYQLAATSSATVLAGSSMETTLNSYNAFMSTQNENDIQQPEMTGGDFVEYQSAASSQGSSRSCSDDLDMLYSVVGGDSLATSEGSSTAFSLPGYHHSLFTTVSDATNTMFNPTLTSVATSQYPITFGSNTLMDLTAASRLVQGDTMFSASSTGLSLMSCSTEGASNVLSNGANSATSCSKASQTISYGGSSTVQISDTSHLLSSANTDYHLSSSPDSPPVRSKPHATTSSSLPPSSPVSSSYGSPSPSPFSNSGGAFSFSPASATNEHFPVDYLSDADSDSDCVPSLPYTNSELVSMPFYKFKKILDSNTLCVKDKDRVKAIRRRGKNKVAAKHCRQKKLGAISGLQFEIDQLKAMKKRLTLRTRSLEQEILHCKHKFSHSSSHNSPQR